MSDPMKELFEQILSNIDESMKNKESDKVTVGICPPELAHKISNNRYEFEDLERSIQRQVDDFSRQLQRQIEPQLHELEQDHKKIWAEIEKALNLSPDKNYGLNKKTREVYERS